MAFPIKTCVICGEEFELKPGKPGFANRCPELQRAGRGAAAGEGSVDGNPEMNAERRRVIRDLLYRKDS